MTHQEAIENLKYLISGDCTDNQMDFVEEIEMAINAIEKQIPKKPRTKLNKGYGDDFLAEHFCPNCGTRRICQDQKGFFAGKQSAFCEDCGQALDWGIHNERT